MEIETFQTFLDKIAVLPINPKYSAAGGAARTESNVRIEGPPMALTHYMLSLKPLKGEAVNFKVPVGMKVSELREKSAEALKIVPVDRCRLIRSGKALHDDSQALESIFGLTSGSAQTLHVLEKPAAVDASSSPSSAMELKSNAGFWSGLEGLLGKEGKIGDAAVRAAILEKFRNAL